MKLTLILVILAAAPAFATTVDFEAQAANAGGFLTGIPDSPLTIGLATFTGGELRSAEVGLPANRSGVYATQGVFGSGEMNPLTIQFAAPISGFAVSIANGDNTATYTVSDDAGDSISASLPSTGAGGARIFSLPGVGIQTVEILSSNADGWNFAIDNVGFSAVPEPVPAFLFALGCSLIVWFARRKPAYNGYTRLTYEHAGEAVSTIRSGTHADARAHFARYAAGARDDDRTGSGERLPGAACGHHGCGHLSSGGDRHGDSSNLEGLAARREHRPH
jgi:hypothetical protein